MNICLVEWDYVHTAATPVEVEASLKEVPASKEAPMEAVPLLVASSLPEHMDPIKVATKKNANELTK